ncbi:MAG TPA: hypothetical protein PK995_07960 [Bacteroidia bacterium]|nr:hypothetical protein [Bacteroidia bacterium]
MLIRWTYYNKVKSIDSVSFGKRLEFAYDANGDRVVKYDVKNKRKEIYIKDAQGNTLAVYEVMVGAVADSLFVKEFNIYGTERIGYMQERNYISKKCNTPLCSTITLNNPIGANSTMKTFLPTPNITPIQPLTTPTFTTFLGGSGSSLVNIYFGKKRYELTDWLGNVRVVISDKKIPDNTGGNIVLNYRPEILSIRDYYAFGSEINERTFEPIKPKYRYGFNTQEKVLEINKDHYTARYWEYDSKVVIRWNLDTKSSIDVSPYAIVRSNPILNADPNGDTIRTNKEGANNISMALNSILDGKANPVGYDTEKGIITFDEKIFNENIDKYNQLQKDILNRFNTLITHKTDINFRIVDIHEKLDDLGGESLKFKNRNGVVITEKLDDVIQKQNAYVARNPFSIGENNKIKNEKPEYSGIVTLHELTGHAYLNITQPMLDKKTHNTMVEQLQRDIQKIYKINGTYWYKGSPVQEHKE